MKQEAGLIVTVCAALSLTCVAFSGEPTPVAPVVGHEFKGISAPGVTGVFWTRRKDHYTLQFQFNTPPGIRRVDTLAAAGLGATPAPTGQAYPDVRVQLHDRNGGTIPHLRRLAVDPALKSQSTLRGALDGARRSEIVYTFYLSDGEHAESVTVQIDGREFVEKVPRLSTGG